MTEVIFDRWPDITSSISWIDPDQDSLFYFGHDIADLKDRPWADVMQFFINSSSKCRIEDTGIGSGNIGEFSEFGVSPIFQLIAKLSMHQSTTFGLHEFQSYVFNVVCQAMGVSETSSRYDNECFSSSILRIFGSDTPAGRALLETYWIVVTDHGLTAPTAAVRIAASTGARKNAAILVGLAVLSGQRHAGSLPFIAEYQGEYSTLSDYELQRLISEKLAAGQRIAGFGQQEYVNSDPRADILREKLYIYDAEFAERVLRIERNISRTIFSRKGAKLITNVEFYGAAILSALKIRPDLFILIFCVARVCGWLQHYEEQSRDKPVLFPKGKVRSVS